MSTIDLFVDLNIHDEDSDLDSGEVVNSLYRPTNEIEGEITDLISSDEDAEVESHPQPPAVADPIPRQVQIIDLETESEQEEDREEDREEEMEERMMMMMPPGATKFVGAYISKRLRGVESVGRVANYNFDSGLYKIDYGYGVEEITAGVLIRHMILLDDFRKVYHRSLCGRVKTTKKKIKVDLRIKKTTGMLRPKKPPSTKKKKNIYIPLALRETKRDAYYWY